MSRVGTIAFKPISTTLAASSVPIEATAQVTRWRSAPREPAIANAPERITATCAPQMMPTPHIP